MQKIFRTCNFHPKKHSPFIFGIFILMAVLPCLLHADGFLQWPRVDITVYEPGQKAIIGWDGTTEIMILSTDVYASEQTWVVELIPFPAMPENPVIGSFASFTNLEEIINTRGIKPETGDVNDDRIINIVDALLVAQYYVGLHTFLPNRTGADVNGNGTIDIIDALIIAQRTVHLNPPSWKGGRSSIDIVFKEQLGVHNLTGLHTTDAAELISLAGSLLAMKETEIDVAWEELRNLATDYINQGMEYWVLDLLELGDNTKSREPVIYAYPTEYLFFPLKISSASQGNTMISIFTLSENTLAREHTASNFKGYWVRGCVENLYLNRTELLAVSPEIAALFPDKAKLGFYQFGGVLKDLDMDFIAR